MNELHLYDPSGKSLHDQACGVWDGVMKAVLQLQGDLDRALDDRIDTLTVASVLDSAAALAGYSRELHDVLVEMVKEGP